MHHDPQRNVLRVAATDVVEADKCRFKESTCHGCGKKGYIKRACRSKIGGKPTKWLDMDQLQDACDDDDLMLCYMDQPTIRPIRD